MNHRLSRLANRYAGTLRKFMADEEESSLAQAYALGRGAIAQGLGVLDLARVHQRALCLMLRSHVPRKRQNRTLAAAETVLLESLSPFEATHRGFRETNSELQQLISMLERRNQELGASNRQLKDEITVRRRTEKALRDSERHFRRLFRQATLMQDKLRRLSNRILHAQEEERQRISRELHDEAGQALTAISVTLAGLRGKNHTGNGIKKQKLDRAQRLLEQTMEALHNFARELRPAALDELGLLPALRSYLAGFAERTGLAYRFSAHPAAEALGKCEKTVLFRVAQESLTNVARHAHATAVDFRIRKRGNRICMLVADNGRSFEASLREKTAAPERLGVLGMQERVRLVGGHFTLRPKPGRGTIVCVTVPLRMRPVRRRRKEICNPGKTKSGIGVV